MNVLLLVGPAKAQRDLRQPDSRDVTRQGWR